MITIGVHRRRLLRVKNSPTRIAQRLWVVPIDESTPRPSTHVLMTSLLEITAWHVAMGMTQCSLTSALKTAATLPKLHAPQSQQLTVPNAPLRDPCSRNNL